MGTELFAPIPKRAMIVSWVFERNRVARSLWVPWGHINLQQVVVQVNMAEKDNINNN